MEDIDDSFAGHAGSTIVPPSIAVGEAIGSSGRDLITAVVTAYEVLGRIAIAMEPSKEYVAEVHGLGTYQTFGSVIAASKLLSLSKYEVQSALGIAGANAPVPSLWKTSLNPIGATTIKNNYGTASEVGVRSALLAKEGLEGPHDIFEGNKGFWRWFSDRCKYNLIDQGLGEEYLILETPYKQYPTCWFHHPAIDAVLEIQRKHRFHRDKIEKIKIGTFTPAIEGSHDLAEPKGIVKAQQSMKYSIAVSLAGITPGQGWYANDTLNDPEIIKIAKKIELLVNPEAEKPYPQKMIAYVKMTVSGETYYARVDCPKGDALNPLTDHELNKKFMSLASYLGSSKREKIMDTINNIEKVKDIRTLTSLLS